MELPRWFGGEAEVERVFPAALQRGADLILSLARRAGIVQLVLGRLAELRDGLVERQCHPQSLQQAH